MPDETGVPLSSRLATGPSASNPVALRRPEDFRRLLQRRPLARHAGWSLHGECPAGQQLSTRPPTDPSLHVDDRSAPGPVIGVVLSRRNVRRAVTRNLMRRLWRACLAAVPQASLAGWCLVLRRTAVWDRTAFPSASSDALRRRLRDDFGTLLASALRAMAAPTMRSAVVTPQAGPT